MEVTFKFAAIIVVYNKEIKNSITYRTITEIDEKNLDIYIVDNSIESNSNSDYCDKKGIYYISMSGNKGLSKAYNTAIDHCYGKYDVVILMDDDTEVPHNYFEVLKKALNAHPEVDIFAPIVYGQDKKIYSPNEFNFLRNHFIRSRKQEVSQKRFNAIASMLAIRIYVFDDYRFNEKLFVDQVDQNFFCDQRTKGRKFMKLDCIIHQNFYQRGKQLSPTAGWNRLKLRIIDIMHHANLMGGGKYRLLGLIKCFGLGVQIGKKSRSIVIPFKAIILSLSTLFEKE